MGDYLAGAIQSPQPGGVTLDRSLPPRVVWHITWDALNAQGGQPQMSAVSNYLKNQGYCPHLIWNPFTGEIEQYYPASVGGRALKYNNQDGVVCIQIEVFFTPGCVVNGVKYNTVADTPCVGLDKILAWTDSFNIPRVWPMGAPQWQNNARDVDIWNNNAGHYGHCHSPGDDHTDPGPMPSLGAIQIANTGGSPSIPQEDEDDEMAMWVADPGDGKLYLCNGIQKWHIPDNAYYIHIQTLTKQGVMKVFNGGKAIAVPAIGALVKDML